jgi:hypothetical protein
MSRIELAGYGTPIPTISLPDPNASGERPTLELVLENGVPFEKADFVSLGYTHYEVWCVGGAGGKGGDAGLYLPEGVFTPETMPLDVYNAFKELETRDTGMIWVPAAGQWMTQGQYWDYTGFRFNQSYFTTTGFTLVPAFGYGPSYAEQSGLKNAVGGGGGGGGTHVVFGELDELPDSVAVVVGDDGGDGALGQQQVAGTLTPQPHLWHMRHNYILANNGDWPMRYYSAPADVAKVELINAWWYRWPEPHTTLESPQPGQDGQASSFGDFCQASGGKGGGPSVTWPSGVKTYSGYGGDGGSGDRLAAGGGGLGALTPINGADGIWDGSIGGGGGGGLGGIGNRQSLMFNPTGQSSEVVERKASNGGRGAFSYLDTTVYGQREFASPYYNTGQTIGQAGNTSLTIVPGGGGGVRANRKRLVGSDADGYLPEGMVLLRLMKLD